MTTRKQLRDGVKAVLDAQFPTYKVSTNRIEDLRDVKNAIIVTLENVEVQYQLDGSKEYEGELNIQYIKLNGTDDQLDTAADQIESAIKSQSPAITGTRSFLLEGFSYEDYDSSSNSITLTYQVRF